MFGTMNQETEGIWDKKKLAGCHEVGDKSKRVQLMFSNLAGRYDLLNRILSFNMDRNWRKKAVRLSEVVPGDIILDICCGTGDLAFEFSRYLRKYSGGIEGRDSFIYGLDFAEPMVQMAMKKQREYGRGSKNSSNMFNINWLCADGELPPFGANQFDCISCAFGIRNLQDPGVGIGHIHRMLKDGGRIVILEFGLPDNFFLRFFYQSYFRLVLPVVGGMISGDRNNAYKYLPVSVGRFDTINHLDRLLNQVGFTDIRVRKICFGTVLAIVAVK